MRAYLGGAQDLSLQRDRERGLRGHVAAPARNRAAGLQPGMDAPLPARRLRGGGLRGAGAGDGNDARSWRHRSTQSPDARSRRWRASRRPSAARRRSTTTRPSSHCSNASPPMRPLVRPGPRWTSPRMIADARLKSRLRDDDAPGRDARDDADRPLRPSFQARRHRARAADRRRPRPDAGRDPTGSSRAPQRRVSRACGAAPSRR